jgi:hypothetical protein
MNLSVTPRQAAAGLGVLLAIVGLLALFLPITVTTDQYSVFGESQRVNCGPALTGNSTAQPDCADATSGRQVWAWPLTIAGVLAVAGAVLVQPAQRRDNAA